MSEAAVFLLMLFMLAVWIAISAFVAAHADGNDVPGGVLWGVLVFITGVVGLAIYGVAFIIVSEGGDNGPPY